MGKLQYNEAMSLKKDANSSPALLDLFGSARPKVYAMLQLLKIRYKDKVELTNEHYRICSMPITVKDKVSQIKFIITGIFIVYFEGDTTLGRKLFCLKIGRSMERIIARFSKLKYPTSLYRCTDAKYPDRKNAKME